MVNSLRILRVIVYRVGQAPFSNIPMTILTQRRRLLCSLFAGFCLPLESQSAQLDYAERDEVRLWAAQFSERYQIDFSWTLNTLHQARYLEVAHKIMSRPKLTATSTPKNWLAHRNMFLTAERIQSGVAFYRENAEALSLAYAKWHVPAEIITAVIGIETIYGKKMGRYLVIDALCTLSFDYTRRAQFFRNELSAYLLWCNRTKRDPLAVRGSFAGAIGMCQFMPSSILQYGQDMDDDGDVDLILSASDAIGSVGNYLSQAGWSRDLPLTWECEANENIARELDCGGINTNTTLQNALDAGVLPREPISNPLKTPVLLVDLPIQCKDGSSLTLWRLATQNYAALLHYNQSYFYAESVCELATKIAYHAGIAKAAHESAA